MLTKTTLSLFAILAVFAVVLAGSMAAATLTTSAFAMTMQPGNQTGAMMNKTSGNMTSGGAGSNMTK